MNRVATIMNLAVSFNARLKLEKLFLSRQRQLNLRHIFQSSLTRRESCVQLTVR